MTKFPNQLVAVNVRLSKIRNRKKDKIALVVACARVKASAFSANSNKMMIKVVPIAVKKVKKKMPI